MSMEEQTGFPKQAKLAGAWPDAQPSSSDRERRLKEELAGRLSLKTEDLVIDTYKDARRQGSAWREAVDRACEVAAFKSGKEPREIRDQVVRIIEAYSTRL